MKKPLPGIESNPKLTTAIIAILVHRLGNKVVITQEDFDIIAYGSLREEGYPDGSFSYEYEHLPKVG